MTFCSYHTHTRWSDGKSDIAAMVAAAADAGLAEIGISDHYVFTPWENGSSWSMPMDGLEAYIEEIRENAAGAGVAVRVGIEADYFPQTWQRLETRLRDRPFDYVIGSVHYVGEFPIDSTAAVWEPLEQKQIDAIHRGYWQAVRELAETGIFDIVGHLDLPKKFAFLPACDLSAEITAALDAIAAADLAVELNTSGWDKPCADGYPAEPLVRALAARNVPMLISADAHAPTELIRHYDQAVRRLRAAGYREIVRFDRRRRIPAPLPEMPKSCGVQKNATGETPRP